MTRTALDQFAPTRLVTRIQSPALRLGLRAWPLAREPIPAAAGIYIALAATVQSSYVGTSRDLRSRVPGSVRSNLPHASHILLLTPEGLPWTSDQRHTLEALLIRTCPGALNRSPGQPALAPDDYLEAVVEAALTLPRLLLPRPATPGRHVPTQGSIARDIVLGENRHPVTVGQVTDRLRDLGWPLVGATPHRTLRRDLRQVSRGGNDDMRVTGPWSDPATHIYVVGRRYATGWRPGVRRGADSPPDAARYALS